jgi:GGDEF domain-containing protein
MANDYRTERVAFIGRVNEYAREHESHHRHPPGHYRPPEPPPSEHSVTDAASILGLPEGALTPQVMAAVQSLLAEADRLRWHDEHHRRRTAYLEALAERHSAVPALNRRGFMRELESFLTGTEPHGTLVLLHVGGVERLALVQGLAAGDGALRHVCANLVGALRGSDPLGLVGGSDFAVLLAGSDMADADGKVAEVVSRINGQPFTWLNQPVTLELRTGSHPLGPGENAEMALAAADRARRGI